MSLLSSVLMPFEKFFTGFFAKFLASDEAAVIENAIVKFVKTDVGKTAVDAVQYASTLIGKSDPELKAAAAAALKADLKAAGKDVEGLAESTLNLFVEMAYTYVKGTIATLPAAVK